MIVFVAYVLWVISRCFYKSLADMTDSNCAPGNHGHLKPWLKISQQKPPTAPYDFTKVINAWSWPLLCGYAVHWTARWGSTTYRRRWGWWCLLAEMGMTCWRRTCWPCFLSQNFHELHVNVQWWSLSAYFTLKSGEYLLQVPQSNRSLKFDLHPFCWRNVRRCDNASGSSHLRGS